MSRILHVDADDPEAVGSALAECEKPPRGGVVVMHVMHETWCKKPDGGPCICRDDYRDPAAGRIALAKQRAKNKAARAARKRGRR